MHDFSTIVHPVEGQRATPVKGWLNEVGRAYGELVKSTYYETM